MIKRIIPAKKMQPQLIPIGGSVEIHAKSLASFKAISSKWNKVTLPVPKIPFLYVQYRQMVNTYNIYILSVISILRNFLLLGLHI